MSKKNTTITTNNGETVVQRLMSQAAPTPLTGGDAIANAMAKAMEKRENALFAGQKKVLANSMRGQLTTDAAKKIRYAQNALIESALAAYEANKGATGKWTGDMKSILSAGRNAASEAFSQIGEDELVDCIEVVEQA